MQGIQKLQKINLLPRQPGALPKVSPATVSTHRKVLCASSFLKLMFSLGSRWLPPSPPSRCPSVSGSQRHTSAPFLKGQPPPVQQPMPGADSALYLTWGQACVRVVCVCYVGLCEPCLCTLSVHVYKYVLHTRIDLCTGGFCSATPGVNCRALHILTFWGPACVPGKWRMLQHLLPEPLGHLRKDLLLL